MTGYEKIRKKRLYAPRRGRFKFRSLDEVTLARTLSDDNKEIIFVTLSLPPPLKGEEVK